MQLSDLMQGYFSGGHQAGFSHPDDLHDSTGSPDWEIVESPERLIKDYKFSSRQTALEFLRQLFLFEDSINHHAKISIDFNKVRIEVHTHDIQRVTELDTEYAQVSDQIFVDVEGDSIV